MDELLQKLKHEMNDLRDQSAALRNQIWLMYVTFEDFVCLTYPGKSETILSTREEVNNHLDTQTATATRRKSKKRSRDSPDKATKETCEVYKQTLNLVDEHQNLNKFKLSIGEVTYYHRFARKRRLNRASRNNTPLDDRINRVHGVKDLNSIGSDLTDMPYREKDRMHERRKRDLRSNVTLTKDYGFGNSWRTRQSGDITNKNCRLTDNLVNHNDLEQYPKNKNIVDNRLCQLDNQPLKLTNRCLNQPADHCAGKQSGLSTCHAYPKDGIPNNHLNLSCSAANSPLPQNLINDLDRRNNIHNVSAFNPGDSKSARFRLKLDLDRPILLRKAGRNFSHEHIDGVSGKNNTSDLNRSASFDNVLKPEGEMSAKSPSCESSPVTISSGYESDSMPTNEADIDNIFVQGRKTENKRPVPPVDLPIDYFSMSDGHPSPHGQSICTGAVVTRKPETVVRNEPNGQLQQNKPILKETTTVQTCREQTDNQTPARFSPAQINNYQLTKVARSMFEIIHDLQAEKEEENKAKGRKPKRHVQWRKDRTTVIKNPVTNCENNVNNQPTQQENCTPLRESTTSAPFLEPSKVSVRCLRRPLGSDPSFLNRQMLPHSSEFDRQQVLAEEYPAFSMSHRSAHPTEFSRQFSEPEIRNCNTNPENFPMNHSFDSRDQRHQIVFNGCAPYATTKLPGCSPYATTRLPGCQTPKRDEKDDHVYETIPGEDLLQYEEILKMRLQGLLPRYHPPALPARNINDRKMSEPIRNNFHPHFRSQQQNIPDNRPSIQNMQINCNNASTSCERNQQFNKPRSYSYDPSDSSKTVPNEFFSKWSAAELLNYIDGIRQPPPKRRENFYFLLNSKQKRACFSESLEIENKIKGMGINFEENRRSRQDADGYTSMDNEPLSERTVRPLSSGLQNMQSTYV